MVAEDPICVSVIVPSLNRPTATLRAVRSILAQRPFPMEVLVVDDASEHPVDESELIDLAANEDAVSIRLIRHAKNHGAGAARNTGVENARCDYVAFLDSDDLWCPGKLAAQLVHLDASQPLLAATCGWHELRRGELSRKLRVPVEGNDLIHFASGCWFCPGSTLILPRAGFKIVGPFDTTLARLEDYEWGLRFAAAGGRLAVAPVGGAVISVGYRYRAKIVDAACRVILDKHGQTLSGKAGRLMRSYLAQQRAVTHLAEELSKRGRENDPSQPVALKSFSNVFQAATASLWYAPRVHFHLHEFWTYTPTLPLDPHTEKLLNEAIREVKILSGFD